MSTEKQKLDIQTDSRFGKKDIVIITNTIGNIYTNAAKALDMYNESAQKADDAKTKTYFKAQREIMREANAAYNEARACAKAIEEFLETGQTQVIGKDGNNVEISIINNDDNYKYLITIKDEHTGNTTLTTQTNDIKTALSNFEMHTYDPEKEINIKKADFFKEMTSAAKESNQNLKENDIKKDDPDMMLG